MTCSLCEGTAYAAVPGGRTPCLGCEAGRKIAEGKTRRIERRNRRNGVASPAPSADRFEAQLDRYERKQLELEIKR